MFEKKKKRSEYKLVGAQLPPQFHNYLTLYSLAKDISKITILRHILEDWMHIKPNPLKYEEESALIQGIVNRIKVYWKIEHTNSPDLTMEAFMSQTSAWLKKKDINENHVRIIINCVTKEINNGKKE